MRYRIMQGSRYVILIGLLQCFYTAMTQDIPGVPKCTLDDNSNGFCVNYYQCKNGSIVTTGEGLLTPKSDTCKSEDKVPKVCCARGEIDLSAQKSVSKCGAKNTVGTFSRKLSPSMSGPTIFGELPWSVALFSTDKEQDLQDENGYFCGGTLIHPSVVLTAAHCFNNRVPSELLVRTGDWKIHETSENRKHQESKVNKIITHEDYYDGNKANNVALLILSKPAVLDVHISPICLPNEGTLPSAGSVCFTAGWGRDINDIYPNVLGQVEMKITDRAACQEAYRKGIPNPRYKLHDSFICASSTVDRCTADGGAPLFCSVPGQNNSFLQYGILSWATGCDSAKLPAIYASVSKFRKWIDTHVANNKFDSTSYTYAP